MQLTIVREHSATESMSSVTAEGGKSTESAAVGKNNVNHHESSNKLSNNAGGGGNGSSEDRRLDWRLNPYESFSDWRIEIVVVEHPPPHPPVPGEEVEGDHRVTRGFFERNDHGVNVLTNRNRTIMTLNNHLASRTATNNDSNNREGKIPSSRAAEDSKAAANADCHSSNASSASSAGHHSENEREYNDKVDANADTHKQQQQQPGDDGNEGGDDRHEPRLPPPADGGGEDDEDDCTNQVASGSSLSRGSHNNGVDTAARPNGERGRVHDKQHPPSETAGDNSSDNRDNNHGDDTRTGGADNDGAKATASASAAPAAAETDAGEGPSVAVASAASAATAESTTEQISAVYHVHKCVLSFGPRRCDYFTTVFNSLNTTHQNVISRTNSSTFDGKSFMRSNNSFNSDSNHSNPAMCSSRLRLPKIAADVFPKLLDFVYGAPLQTPLNVDAVSATALYALGEKLSNKSLRYEVKRFFRKGLDFGSCHVCYKHAKILNNAKVIRQLAKYCAKNINRHDAEDEGSFIVEEADTTFWIDVLEDFLSNGYGHISCATDWILEVCKKKKEILKDQGGEEVFERLTSERYLPKVPTQDALEFMKLEEYICGKDDIGHDDVSSLQKRCVLALYRDPEEWSNNDEYQKDLLDYLMEHPAVLASCFSQMGSRLCALQTENNALIQQFDQIQQQHQYQPITYETTQGVGPGDGYNCGGGLQEPSSKRQRR